MSEFLIINEYKLFIALQFALTGISWGTFYSLSGLSQVP